MATAQTDTPKTTTDQWPVLPRNTDIAVKCAPLELTATAAEKLLLTLFPPDCLDEDGKLKPGTKALAITDDETASKAADLVAHCTKALNSIEKRRLEYTAPARDFQTDINNEVKLYTTRVQKAKTDASVALLAFEQDKRKKAAEAEAAARKTREDEALEQAKQLEASGNTQAAQRVVEVASSAPRRSAVRPTETRGVATGRKVSVRVTWTGSVASLNTILQAVIDGKLTSEGIEVSQAWLNRIATAHGKEETVYGVLVKRNEGLG